ncbi:MAG: PQQ-binding-like beta-propeller repeat protein [Planctomycetota bacterium]|nr:PQQ-binding-like beta-propeller repeat protein [Planctomycetota bacterium]
MKRFSVPLPVNRFASLMARSTVFFLLFFAFHGTGKGEDWKNFRGNNRDGKSETTGIGSSWERSAPGLVRILEGAGMGYASLCVVKNRVYTTGNSDRSQFVVGFSLETGEQLWKTEIVDVIPNHATPGSRSTPTWFAGNLYVVASSGQILCLDDSTGKIRWQKNFQKEYGGKLMSGWGYSESPYVDADRIVFTPGGENDLVVALSEVASPADGQNGVQQPGGAVQVQTEWSLPESMLGNGKNLENRSLLSGAAYSSILRSTNLGVTQYIQFVAGGIVGIDPVSGKLLWSNSSVANRTANICMPLVYEDYLVYSSAPGGGLAIYRFEKKSGELNLRPVRVFRSRQLQCHHGGMIAHKGFLYFGSGENRGYPTCVDLKQGTIRWGGSFRGPGRGSASVVYVDDKVLFRDQNGVVALVEASSEKYNLLGHFRQEIASNNRSWAHPVVVDGKLLLREQDQIMIYDLR